MEVKEPGSKGAEGAGRDKFKEEGKNSEELEGEGKTEADNGGGKESSGAVGDGTS